MEMRKEITFMDIYLGPCVAVRTRQDGTARLRFEVRRNRPLDWRPSIPILVNGRDGCVLDKLTPAEISSIVARAEDLYRQLEKLRASDISPAPLVELPEGQVTWERLIEVRREHGTWQLLSRASQATYASTQKRLLEIFGGDPSLAPSVVLDSQVDRLLRARISSPHRRRAILMELRILIRLAIRHGWRDFGKDILFYGRRPTAGFQIWTSDDVRQVYSRCLVENERGLARLLVTQWEIGQRLRSVRNFRYGREYIDGTFQYFCAKTGALIYLEVLDKRHRAILDEAYRDGEYMFPRAIDGKPFSSRDLSKRFARIRAQLPQLDQKLQLRYLRHTVIVQLAVAGCTVPEIASVTGHQMNTVHQVLEHYLPRLPELARAAMAKRHTAVVHGMQGELILENSRRIFLSKPPEELTPKAPEPTPYRGRGSGGLFAPETRP
jgi:hypothetical protein